MVEGNNINSLTDPGIYVDVWHKKTPKGRNITPPTPADPKKKMYVVTSQKLLRNNNLKYQHSGPNIHVLISIQRMCRNLDQWNILSEVIMSPEFIYHKYLATKRASLGPRINIPSFLPPTVQNWSQTIS